MTEYISCADTAKLVRAALKKHWPLQKFGVRSKTYSGGASIDVDWTDGPTAAAVDKVIGQYEAGRFDGMQDLAYSADHWLTPDGIATVHKEYHNIDHFEPTPAPPGARLVHFGAHYVHGNRTITAPVLRQAALTVCQRFGMLPPPEVIDSEPLGKFESHAYLANDDRRIGGDWLTTVINREANATDCYTTPLPPMGKDMRKALKQGDVYRRLDACQGGFPKPSYAPATQVLMEGAC